MAEQIPPMRTFLFNTLRDLDKLAGLKQFHQLAELEDSQVQIKDLLDKIMFIVDQFKNIPDKAKQDIIYAGVVTDPQFYGLNAKVVYKWLVAEAHKYRPKSVEEPATEDSKPLERGSEQYLKRLEEWEKSLQPLIENISEEQRIANKEVAFFGPDSKRQKYTPISDEEARQKLAHYEELREKWRKDNNVMPEENDNV